MTDTTLNYYVARGTNAERLAFTPNPGTPAAGPDLGVFFFETDLVAMYAWDGAAWQPIVGSVISVDVAGGTTGLTTSGGPITSSGTITLAGTLAIANGGTGATSAPNAITALLPSQGGNNGKFLTTNGTSASWGTAATGSVTSVDVSGGTTGLTTSGGPVTGSGTITLAGTLAATNGGTGLTALGTGVATWLGTPSSANLASALTDETGSGKVVFDTSPTLVTPNVGVATGDAYKLSSSGIVTETGTSRTLSATDNGVVIYFTNTGAITCTMFAVSAGFSCSVLQGAAGQITFAAGGQTMTVAGGFTKTHSAGAMAVIVAPVANTFFISGMLA